MSISISTVSKIDTTIFQLLQQDPIRPTIDIYSRVGRNKDVFLLHNNEDIDAVACISYNDFVPINEAELFIETDHPTVVVFYSIWSYHRGMGRHLLEMAVRDISENQPHIQRIVTMSPKTDMAREFHIRNGAMVFQENLMTVNYEYTTPR